MSCYYTNLKEGYEIRSYNEKKKITNYILDPTGKTD